MGSSEPAHAARSKPALAPTYALMPRPPEKRRNSGQH
jgi:hypothetical protein